MAQIILEGLKGIIIMCNFESAFSEKANEFLNDVREIQSYKMAMNKAKEYLRYILPAQHEIFLQRCKDAWFFDESEFQSHFITVDSSILIDQSQINPGWVSPLF